MKIFFPLGAFFPSQIGGPCNTLYWHTSALKKSCVDVYIVTTTFGIGSGEVPRNVLLQNECGSVFYGSGNSVTPRIIREALRFVKKASIIHLNSLFTPLSITVFFYVRIFFHEKKIVWSARGELSPNALYYSSWKKKPLMWLYKKLIKSVVFHSTSNQETADIYLHFPSSRVVQIPNLIKPYRRLNLSVEKQILFVGRIHPIKAIHKLIEALPISRLFLEKEFKLIIAGTHEERYQGYVDKLLDLVERLNLKNRVLFTGHVVNEEKEMLYSRSYVLILPSETENFGNVVVEALNQGTPVIASKYTPWSILESYNCGFHTDNTPHDIATCIDKMLGFDMPKYNRYRQNAQALVDDKFSIDTQINNWIEVYRKLL